MKYLISIIILILTSLSVSAYQFNHTYQNNVTLIKEYCPDKNYSRPFYTDSLCKPYEINKTEIKIVEVIKEINNTILLNQTCQNNTQYVNIPINNEERNFWNLEVMGLGIMICLAIGYFIGNYGKVKNQDIFNGGKL